MELIQPRPQPPPGGCSEWIAEPQAEGMRCDRYLARCLPGLSRSRLQYLIREGKVTLDGGLPKAAEPVWTGARVRVEVPEIVPPAGLVPQAIPLEILFEDSQLLVLDKPSGLVVHPGAGVREGTLVQALLHHCKDLSGIGGVERPGIVHRLDKETSGCLVVAKTDQAHRALAAQFAGRTVRKIYLAVVAGAPRRPGGRITARIGRHPVHRQKMAALAAGGREAATGYRVLARGDGQSLIECTLETGRTHQVRVHLKSLGHPVLGDPVYGVRGRFARHLLHAWKLGFAHPVTGGHLEFVAPPPPDFPLLPPAAT